MVPRQDSNPRPTTRKSDALPKRSHKTGVNLLMDGRTTDKLITWKPVPPLQIPQWRGINSRGNPTHATSICVGDEYSVQAGCKYLSYYKSSCRLPLHSTRPSVTFPITQQHRPVSNYTASCPKSLPYVKVGVKLATFWLLSPASPHRQQTLWINQSKPYDTNEANQSLIYRELVIHTLSQMSK